MQNVVIYCRVSTWKQAAGYSLLRQVEYAKDWLRVHKNGCVVGIFSEVASGAGKLPARAAAERVAKLHNALILVEAQDRWSRSGEETPDNVRFTAPWANDLMGKLQQLCRAVQVEEVKRLADEMDQEGGDA